MQVNACVGKCLCRQVLRERAALHARGNTVLILSLLKRLRYNSALAKQIQKFYSLLNA